MKTQYSATSVTASQGYYSRGQVAAMFCVCKETIRRWEKRGQLHPIVINARVVRYTHSDITNLTNR